MAEINIKKWLNRLSEAGFFKSSIRSSMENLDEESFEDLMGWFDQDLYDMLKEKTSAPSEGLQEAIFSLIEEVMQEKEDKVSKEISKLSSKGECEDNHDQCVAIALSKEERGELEEISSGAGGSVIGPAGEVGSEKKCDAGYSMHVDGKCKKDNIVAMPEGLSRVKGIKITYRRQNTN